MCCLNSVMGSADDAYAAITVKKALSRSLLKPS